MKTHDARNLPKAATFRKTPIHHSIDAKHRLLLVIACKVAVLCPFVSVMTLHEKLQMLSSLNDRTKS